jgi:phage terminase small subunit
MASKKTGDGSGLTDKQRAFVRAFTTGDAKGNASAAYRSAFDADGMKPSSIHVEACRMLDHPKVAPAIEAANAQIAQQHRLQGVSLRQRVQDGLLAEAEAAESPAARVRAWELLGKLQGVDAFGADKVETTATVTSQSAQDGLQQAIADALADETVVKLFDK